MRDGSKTNFSYTREPWMLHGNVNIRIGFKKMSIQAVVPCLQAPSNKRNNLETYQSNDLQHVFEQQMALIRYGEVCLRDRL